MSARTPATPLRRQSHGYVKGSDARAELIYEILELAGRIRAWRDIHGEQVVRSDARWRLLRAIERSGCCPTISHLARALRISREAARQLAYAALRDGDIELHTNSQDRRILQAELTSTGRAKLRDANQALATGTAELLNGLDCRELHKVIHVLSVMRRRLLRNEREREDERKLERRRRRGMAPCSGIER